jgi:hypothetical protein
VKSHHLFRFLEKGWGIFKRPYLKLCLPYSISATVNKKKGEKKGKENL